MNKQIQIKRNKPSSTQYRVLYAKTGRKRRLHAATAAAEQHAGLGSDVPNLGIGKALMVILILHVLAIAAIYIHSAFFGNSGGVTANEGQKASLVQPHVAAAVPATPAGKAKPVAAEVQPAVLDLDLLGAAAERYIVMTGDTYAVIAKGKNVDERSLRALNSDRPLRAGVVLDLPAKLSSRPVDPRPVAAVTQELSQKPGHQAPEAKSDDVGPKTKPSDVKATAAPGNGTGFDVGSAPKAVIVKPNRSAPTITAAPTAPAAPAVATADLAIEDSGQRYTIKSGDTLWRISSRFKVSRDAVLKLNGIENPDKLYAGRSIKIPVR